MARLLTELTMFLRESCAQPFEYGENDCGTWVSKWVERCTGVDPAESVRGTYSTEIGCAKLVKSFGGFEQTYSTLLNSSGVLKEDEKCETGGLACINPLEQEDLTLMAIRKNGGWAYKPLRGGLVTVNDHRHLRPVRTIKCWNFIPEKLLWAE